MTLDQLLAGAAVAGLEYDSRRVAPGFIFFAFQGANVDGRRFAQPAIAKGAIAVVSELPAPPDFQGQWIETPHARKALALAARSFYHAPDTRLGITGVTGTNGKTTTTYLIDSILRHAGKITAMLGTIQCRLASTVSTSVNTTPESLDLYRIFDQLERAGGTHVTMEVSSHALALGRVYGVAFHTAVFTNFTRDHLDFHHTMEAYFEAKSLLFAPEHGKAPAWAVVNHDDAYSSRLPVQPDTRRLSYGFKEGSGVRAMDMRMGFEGLTFSIDHEGQRVPMKSPLVGRINVYNILAASGAALSYGLEWDAIREGIAKCDAVPGRFERVDEGQNFMVVVDYAHTDDALRNVIAVARGLAPARVITLFGCGGDRDRTKRPLMGAAAAEGSDLVVLTSDNPRSEDPIAIMNDALVGLRRYDTPHIVEPDRERAIKAAIGRAGSKDIVILAGKGHEPYQVLKEKTIAFDDRLVAHSVLQNLGYGKK